jgi:hypothetical protein
MWAGGCENYGWGATFPTLIIRNIIGFRETTDLDKSSFNLAPALSNSMFEKDKTYGITNLNYRGMKFDVNYKILANEKIEIKVTCRSDISIKIQVVDEYQNEIAGSSENLRLNTLTFTGENYKLYTVLVRKIYD